MAPPLLFVRSSGHCALCVREYRAYGTGWPPATRSECARRGRASMGARLGKEARGRSDCAPSPARYAAHIRCAPCGEGLLLTPPPGRSLARRPARWRDPAAPPETPTAAAAAARGQGWCLGTGRPWAAAGRPGRGDGSTRWIGAGCGSGSCHRAGGSCEFKQVRGGKGWGAQEPAQNLDLQRQHLVGHRLGEAEYARCHAHARTVSRRALPALVACDTGRVLLG